MNGDMWRSQQGRWSWAKWKGRTTSAKHCSFSQLGLWGGNHARTLHEKDFPRSVLSRQMVDCAWQMESMWPCPLPRLCKISSPAFFPPTPCSSNVDAQALPAWLANAKEKNWHLLGPSLFVFQLFLRHMSAFMSSLRQNIKAAHSLLISTMTTQSSRRTKFIACACTFLL